LDLVASGGPHEIFVDSTASLALQQSILADKRLQAIAQDICGLPLEFRHIRGPKNPSDPLTRPPFADIDPNLAEIKMFNPLLTDPAWAHIRKELHLGQDSVLAQVAMITRSKAGNVQKEVAKLPDVEVHIESFVPSADDADSPHLVDDSDDEDSDDSDDSSEGPEVLPQPVVQPKPKPKVIPKKNLKPAPQSLPKSDSVNDEDLKFAQWQQADPMTLLLISFVRQGRPRDFVPPSPFTLKRRTISRMASGLVWNDERRLLLRVSVTSGKEYYTVYVPQEHRFSILDKAHAGGGLVRACVRPAVMRQEILRKFYWENLLQSCETFRADDCNRCDLYSKASVRPVGFLSSTMSTFTGQILSLDLVPFPDSPDQYQGAAVLVDKFSGQVFSTLMTTASPTAQQCVEMFDFLVQTFPGAETLIVDKASVLTSKEFQDALALRNIHVVPAVRGHQQFNFVERTIQTLKNSLRRSLAELSVNAWSRLWYAVTQFYNYQPSASRGNFSPVTIAYGVDVSKSMPMVALPATVGDLFAAREHIARIVREEREVASDSQAEQYNKKRNDLRFEKGDIVVLQNLSEPRANGAFNLSPKYQTPLYQVAQVMSETTYLLRSAMRDSKMSPFLAFSGHLKKVGASRLADADLEPGTFIVNRILTHKGRGDSFLYCVEWSGYHRQTPITWESFDNLREGAADVIARYEAIFPEAQADRLATPQIAAALLMLANYNESTAFSKSAAADSEAETSDSTGSGTNASGEGTVFSVSTPSRQNRRTWSSSKRAKPSFPTYRDVAMRQSPTTSDHLLVV
jgi:hypothetical protein